MSGRRDEKFRRQLRNKYLNLITDTNNLKSILCQPGSTELLDKIEEGNELFNDVVHAREGALDAQWLTQTSKYGLEQVNRIHVGQEWDPKRFLKNIIAKYKLDGSKEEEDAREEDDEHVVVDIDWTKLGCDVFQYFNRTPTVTFMNGPLQKVEVRQIQRKQKEKVTEDENQKTERPAEIERQEKQDETSRQVSNIYRKLKDLQERETDQDKVSFVDVVIDPTSFTKSIEHLFHYAFLIKEGRAGLKLDKDQKSKLDASIEQPPTANSTDVKKNQAVLKLTLDTWKKLATKVSPSVAQASRKRPSEDTQYSQAKRRRL